MSISSQTGKAVRRSEASLPETLMAGDISRQHFVFDETPVSQVFAALEEACNTEIIYDDSLLGNCPLNATLVGAIATVTSKDLERVHGGLR